jgi:hypothetical protein
MSLAPVAIARPAAHAAPDTAAITRECYAAVGPLLQSAGGKLTPEVRSAYLEWAEKTVLQQLHESSQTVPPDCLAEVRKEGAVRDAIFGSVFPPDPSILQNYAQLRAQLGAEFLAKYRSLAVAIAVAKRTKGVESAAVAKGIGRDYQPDFWTDESLQIPGSEAEKSYIRAIADFMTESQASALDLYQNPSVQVLLKAYLEHHSVPANFVGEVRKSVQFGERLKFAMTIAGQRPAARQPKPSTVAWLRHLAAIYETTHISTPTVDGRAMPWPLFPLDGAPWPLLMPLAHAIPLSEANYIWEAFQGEHGPDRYHTYGPYRGDDDVMPDSLRPSPWFWDAWPDRIVHGGMCVPISKGTVDLYSALGKPAMWAGQPGHANLISFQYVNGAWTAEVEQAFAGGPDVTSAQWYFDEDPGTEIHFRDLYYWPGAEYHLGLALAMNVGLKSYMDTRLAANIFRSMPVEDQRTVGVKLLRSVLLANPFNPEIWYRLTGLIPDTVQAMMVSQAAIKGDLGLLTDAPLNAAPETHPPLAASGQYWQTLSEFVTQYSVFFHDAPRKEEEMHRVYTFVKSAPGTNGDELAAYVEKFAAHDAESPAADVEYDRSLASQGDAYGQLRMGQRYRAGAGVPQSDAWAQNFFARAAGQGDSAAALLLGNMNPAIPGNMIAVTASNTFGQDQIPQHLIDGSGMVGMVHDNEGAAKTMWHTGQWPTPKPPANGLVPSPAWVRFDFARPTNFDSIFIWNHNQANLTHRGFRKTHIYGSFDGAVWVSLTGPRGFELPLASGTGSALPYTLKNDAAGRPLKSVIIAAAAVDGNYGAECYGLSAVRFVVHPLTHTVPAAAIAVTTSSTYSSMQSEQHLIDGSGMMGVWHDNAEAAQTMWHTTGHPSAQPPVQGLAPSPAWVRFDFAHPQMFEAILIWNHNQINLTDRGFHKVRIYGTTDGTTWTPITISPTVELPRASGQPLQEPTAVPNHQLDTAFKSVIIAAEETDGNFGAECYGLSAVRFVIRH